MITIHDLPDLHDQCSCLEGYLLKPLLLNRCGEGGVDRREGRKECVVEEIFLRKMLHTAKPVRPRIVGLHESVS